ncbi:MAG: hypothetical protein IJ685_04620 [Selenomonadaceae bacterium]|nr:hypothetical protein [Selenomonadaceae bacterium]
MYRIPGLNDEESNNLFNQYLQEGLLGEAPPPEGFQAQQPQTPELAQGLLGGDVTQQMQDMSEGGSDTAQSMAALGQHLGETAAAAGRSRIAQQQAANQAAMQQDQQSKGGGLLGGLLKLGANIALNKWIGGMFPKKGA